MNKADNYDYYDTRSRRYVHLACGIHQKYWTDSLLVMENAEKFYSPVGQKTYETPDLQLADSNGRWFTNSSDPEYYHWDPRYDEPMKCELCDLVCDIRDDERYLEEDGACPFPDPAPTPKYTQVQDYDRPCRDFLHPLMLENIDAINRKRRIAAFNHLKQYLGDIKWINALINTGQTITEVWERHYKPVTFYYSSFDAILKYVRSRPEEQQENRVWLKHVWGNAKKSPSYRELRQWGGYWEDELHDTLETIVAGEK